MHDRPRYYELLDASQHVFRIEGGGVYSRWDPASRTWVHVTSRWARDFYSRAVERGDAWPLMPADVDALGVLVGAPMTDLIG